MLVVRVCRNAMPNTMVRFKTVDLIQNGGDVQLAGLSMRVLRVIYHWCGRDVSKLNQYGSGNVQHGPAASRKAAESMP